MTDLAALRPARCGGIRVLTFDNGCSERYESVFVQHPAGEWDRILIARDDGTIAQALVDAINAAGVRVAGDAGHRTDEPHDCFAMNCKALGSEVESLREAVRVAAPRSEDAAPLREAAQALVDSAVLVPMEREDDDDGPAEFWFVHPDPLVALRAALGPRR